MSAAYLTLVAVLHHTLLHQQLQSNRHMPNGCQQCRKHSDY
jgi:hypothetical protein